MNWKKLLYYVPGVGLATHTVKEYRARKGRRPLYNIMESADRRALAVYAIETAYLAFAISSKVAAGYYIEHGIKTKEWNPIKSAKEIVIERKEKRFEKKEKRLEKTVNYENLLKESN